MGEKKTSLLKISGIALSSGILGAALTLGAASQMEELPNASDTVSASQNTVEAETEPLSSTSALSTADIAEQASEAIVGVVNLTNQQSPFTSAEEMTEAGTGSGVIYKVEENAAYIVTNNHVIEGASEVDISLFDGETASAEVIGADALTDIAVLKIEGSYDVEPLAFGDSDSIRAGEEVLAIGNPLGLDLSRTVTQGIVSAVDRTISVTTSAGEWDLDVIQTDAAISPGNSGGALINGAGELIGINSLKMADEDAEGLGFAIPSNDVETLIADMSDDGQVDRSYLGVGVVGVNEAPAQYRMSLPEETEEGVIVASVDETSAAAGAGLQVEDVITSIDGVTISDSTDLRKYLYTETNAGDTVTVEFYRSGNAQTVKVTLTEQVNE
ncbi:PDZ domain-containing protein [Halobacillus litoralis]|uniref:PDZ domain-containing protein n=1 Tax=Halobacillus litoralis TaxID=45668 RepID=A0A845DTM5_9BACI|nr:trypsin-like peptidase domain-containing protein [Halobacillus litoralis]MYL20963.1 PDZ domain-containing protein [Halobacillus litoralis]